VVPFKKFRTFRPKFSILEKALEVGILRKEFGRQGTVGKNLHQEKKLLKEKREISKGLWKISNFHGTGRPSELPKSVNLGNSAKSQNVPLGAQSLFNGLGPCPFPGIERTSREGKCLRLGGLPSLLFSWPPGQIPWLGFGRNRKKKTEPAALPKPGGFGLPRGIQEALTKQSTILPEG